MEKQNPVDLHDLVNQVAEEVTMIPEVAKKLADTLIQKIGDALAQTTFVEIHHLGTLSIKKAAARKGTMKLPNGTTKDFDKPAGLRIKFKPAAGLIKKIAEASGQRVI